MTALLPQQRIPRYSLSAVAVPVPVPSAMTRFMSKRKAGPLSALGGALSSPSSFSCPSLVVQRLGLRLRLAFPRTPAHRSSPRELAFTSRECRSLRRRLYGGCISHESGLTFAPEISSDLRLHSWSSLGKESAAEDQARLLDAATRSCLPVPRSLLPPSACPLSKKESW